MALKSILPRSILDKRRWTGDFDWPQDPLSPPSGQSFERWSEPLVVLILCGEWSLHGLDYGQTMA